MWAWFIRCWALGMQSSGWFILTPPPPPPLCLLRAQFLQMPGVDSTTWLDYFIASSSSVASSKVMTAFLFFSPHPHQATDLQQSAGRDVSSVSVTSVFCLSSNTITPLWATTLKSAACFGKTDGDSLGFIIMPDLFIACLCTACWPAVAL